MNTVVFPGQELPLFLDHCFPHILPYCMWLVCARVRGRVGC